MSADDHARGHLLVVDDERINRMVLTRALSSRGTRRDADNGTRLAVVATPARTRCSTSFSSMS